MTKLVPSKLDPDCFDALVRWVSSNSGLTMKNAMDVPHTIVAMDATNATNPVLAFA
jgi:hypothetical protein